MVRRRNFGKIPEVMEAPSLVEIQSKSFEWFLQQDTQPRMRKRQGLQEILLSFFPIKSPEGDYCLEYVEHSLGSPKYSIADCQRKGLSYTSSLRVRLRLVTPGGIKEQEVYLGELPLMSKTGTFIINGDERVVVSQLHRSPGICFEELIHPRGKRLFSVRIIPYRGSWLEFEFDVNDLLYVYIDRRKKFLATTFLRALGYSTDLEILDCFEAAEEVHLTRKRNADSFKGKILASEVKNSQSEEVLASRGTSLDGRLVRKFISEGVKTILLEKESYPELLNTLEHDRTQTTEEALLEIYRKLRPGDPPTAESARNLLSRLFFDELRYDLGRVGRFVLNRKLGMQIPLTERALDPATIIQTIKYLLSLKKGEGTIDDIDHLGNRRVRTVGELLENQFRIGVSRLARSIREKMTIYEMEDIMPQQLINSNLVSSVIQDFFGRSQLSQFMDQTNPLAEMTHKRRLSALGPGGLSRERAGFEVRDVHHSHYGRICPIETPEGPNIGLIASLSIYARVNEFGFLETPYRKVVRGRVSSEIEYLSADIEDKFVIAQANARVNKSGRFLDERVSCRFRGDFPKCNPEEIDYIDVSPRQLVSVAASLIPFLEHDDANRALMGSNMQRQAVPLLFTEAPLVGTGLEFKVARDSGAVVLAEEGGKVEAVEADKIIIGGRTYALRKFVRSNASTCINQRPLVKVGEAVKKGDLIADGPSTKNGELSLGRDILVAFMPWRGYNFEDAIIISERMVKDDVYTSVHIEEFEIEARDVRLGNEEITRDIPNVSEEALKDLDEEGIVRLGAEVGPGDILVGKISPKSETELSPEEKLLRAIFGEKAQDVRDTSLTVPPGVEGIVVDVRIFTRKSARSRSREERTKEEKRAAEITSYYQPQIKKFKEERRKQLSSLLLGKTLQRSIIDAGGEEVLLAAGKKITENNLKRILAVSLSGIELEKADSSLVGKIRKITAAFECEIRRLEEEKTNEIDKIKKGDELPPGVNKKVVVSVASKKKVQAGDKMAGRHGNKGVIAKILPEEDMPFLPDGRPVEVVLNPLGVPSRMNVGQILETHLGWAAKVLGFSAKTPVFGGATENEIKEELRRAGIPEDGKSILYDGFTGEPFAQRIAVGYIYMMKLSHLVDDKIHARCIGPYSLVTQQPLGGKAQFGGQRFGEMEVWALEAYGAAYTLQELLTVKSDDVFGRTRIYEAIVKGDNALQPGTPESFNVLLKELRSLGLEVKTQRKDASKGQ